MVECNQLVGNLLPLELIRRQNVTSQNPLANEAELPTKVVRVLHGHIHPLTSLWRMRVNGICPLSQQPAIRCLASGTGSRTQDTPPARNIRFRLLKCGPTRCPIWYAVHLHDKVSRVGSQRLADTHQSQ